MNPKRISAIFILLALASWLRIAQASDLTVPDPFVEIGDALQVAVSNQDRVLVSPGINHYAPFTMKSGVPVLATGATRPVIDAGAATHAVLFPPGAASNTILQGFEVVGGDTAVVLQGEGSLLDCIIAADPETQSIGVHHSGGPATIQSCSLAAYRVNPFSS